jgi:hypothetical protein|tara:strand:+ start:267 stop:398 length:132 start_codon:yes stop_codon:yes gene_type:complete
MMQWAIAWVKKQGCRMVQLASDKQRIGALLFYKNWDSILIMKE